MKTLIAYFSAENGTTAAIAQKLAEIIRADLFEIRPQKPYTKADLNYMNPLARCNREKIGNRDVPYTGDVNHFESYERIILGFPIWYAGAPNIVNTFCKAHDFAGKKVYVFATSGGSPIGKTAEKLKPYVRNASFLDAKLVHRASEVMGWLKR